MSSPDRREGNNGNPEERRHIDMSAMPSVRTGGAATGEDRLNKIVHDLRSPLGTMKIWIHLLKTGTLSPEEQTHALEMLQSNASKLEELLEHVTTARNPL